VLSPFIQARFFNELMEAQAGTGRNSGRPAFVFGGPADNGIRLCPPPDAIQERGVSLHLSLLVLEGLLVRISVELGRGAVRQEHRRIVVFETAKEFIEQLLGASRSFPAWLGPEIGHWVWLSRRRNCFDFFHGAHE